MVETIEPYTRGRRQQRKLLGLGQRTLNGPAAAAGDPYEGLNCTRGSILYDFVDVDLSGLTMFPEQLSLAFRCVCSVLRWGCLPTPDTA